jgi:hypothetical protein
MYTQYGRAIMIYTDGIVVIYVSIQIQYNVNWYLSQEKCIQGCSSKHFWLELGQNMVSSEDDGRHLRDPFLG